MFLFTSREVNNNQRKLIVKKIEKILGGLKNKTVAVWGLAFKANTDDIRESAAVEIIESILGKGAKVKAYDPIAGENGKKILSGEIIFCDNSYEALKGSDVLLIATDWDEFKKADLSKIKKLLRHPNVIDGKNIYNPAKMKKTGFNYVSVGR